MYLVFLSFFAFILGIVIGSFLNVCIYRLPDDLSIIKPGSFCPSCKKSIRWFDNIPLLSYLVLGGKCRHCRSAISFQYPAVELLSGLLTALFFYKWHGTPLWLSVSLLAAYLLIIVSAIDFRTMMISDLFSYSLAFLGLASSFVNPSFTGDWQQRIMSSVYGVMAGAGFVYGLSYLGKIIYKKEAVGEGDIFLLGAIGSLAGFYGVLTIIVTASFLGSVYGVSLILLKRADRLSYMPFGPFLAAGCVINMYYPFDLFSFIFS
ncbi:MAG: prepilin peptidase [Elusimicrobia bacterium CG08_land_8_20_14_0_20_51_18]|nr:MAG: prepilin peptidase [Elusimicrobia bacterium CG08_land_8_20_14_0_20_51_18]